jgi:serine/threonine protein kinase
VHSFYDTAYGDESKLSVAYEHIYLNTVIDLLATAGETPFDEVEDILQELIGYKTSLKVDTAEHRAIYISRVYRALARCKFEQGKREEAIQMVVGSDTGYKRNAESTLQSNLDLIMFYSGDSGTKSEAVELSRSVFFDVNIKLNHDQAAAFHRRLSALNATHFTYESILNNPLPLRILEYVGTGAYATVESVEIGTRLYARKSIALPRYSQNRIRQTIQNEISVIRALRNPHIVQVYCTYEEKSRFSIILQPLADCDLEAYLEQHTYTGNPDSDVSHQKLLWKWLQCLAHTLAFIHSKGIRHKDIKTRNVLVKDSEVIFADFGSSHAFLDEGTSVTEGPAFGHTLMYCAPEVVSWANRGRSADIFSLGCVFTEIATSLDNRSISDYYEFRSKETEDQGTETHAYHATLDLVHSWFTQEHVSSEVLLLHLNVVKPMLDTDPMLRPTATASSEEISTVFRHSFDEALPACSKCSREPWEIPSPWSDVDRPDTDEEYLREKQTLNFKRDPKLVEELVEDARHIRSTRDDNTVNDNNDITGNSNESTLIPNAHIVDHNNDTVPQKQIRHKIRHKTLSYRVEAQV